MVIDVEFVGQLVDSMDEAVLKLEQAVADDKKDEANKLRTFIFDLHKQIESALQDVRGQMSDVRRGNV